ncbi:MAG: EAL domain-containing protein [Gemmatimonadetes bacterium]|nr:EAL domain-containing protein [Gemmatimonadota bacterium]
MWKLLARPDDGVAASPAVDGAADAHPAVWLRTPGGRLCLGGACILLVQALWVVAGSPGPRALIAGVAALPIPLAASAAALGEAWRSDAEPRVARAWTRLAVAFAWFTLTNDLWLVHEAGLGAAHSASWIDVAYIAHYPLLVAGLLSFPFAPRRGERLKFWLDVAIVMVCGGAVVWVFVLAPLLRVARGSAWELALSVAYPAGDLALLFGFTVVRLRRRAAGRALALLALGAGAAALTDLAYGAVVVRDGAYHSGGWIDLGWQLTAFFWLAAPHARAWERRAGHTSPDHARSRAADRLARAGELSPLPYAAVALGFGLLLYQLRDAAPGATGVVLTALVLTALVLARQIVSARELLQLQARFGALVQHSSDLITVIAPDTTVRFVSPAVDRVLGWAPDDIVGTRLADLVHPDDEPRLKAFVAGIMQAPGRSASTVCRFRNRDGEWRHIEAVGSCRADDPAIGGIVLNTRDVTERAVLEAQLAHQATHDPLTGLANRKRLRTQIERALAEDADPDTIAVLFLDLDNFKAVNDSFGHGEGDRLLGQVASRLLNATRGCDTVARIGGDEFGVLLRNLASPDDAALVAERIAAAMRRPLSSDAREVDVGVSIGIARATPDSTADDLLGNADLAMYEAKRNGRGRIAVFEPGMQSAIRDKLTLEAEIRAALAEGQFRLHFQPVVDLTTERVVGAEALVRWEHPVRGLVPPAVFIAAAEESGLIVPLGRWVLRAACAEAATWPDSGAAADGITLSVNVSGRQLQDDSICGDVADALRDSGFPPQRLVVEITESVVIQDDDAVIERLRAIRALGVRVAIDDFGTGYSSIQYLQKFPADILKIDRAFISGIGAGRGDDALTRAIVSLGGMLSMRTVAEGVEEPRQRDALRAMGCGFAQGFHYARPLDSAAIAALIRRQRPAAVA